MAFVLTDPELVQTAAQAPAVGLFADVNAGMPVAL